MAKTPKIDPNGPVVDSLPAKFTGCIPAANLTGC
jgi:hypothetical protein